jgi:hypothetical protein
VWSSNTVNAQQQLDLYSAICTGLFLCCPGRVTQASI